jgi:hypothetical protein
MAETLAISARRLVTPITVLLVGLAFAAAVALGFGLRAWTEHASSPATRTIVVQHAPSAPDVCRLGRAC